LVGDDLFENGYRVRIAELFNLLGVSRDVAALVDFEAAEREARPADAIGKRVSITGVGAVVSRDRCAESGEPRFPKLCVMFLRKREMAKRAAAVRFALVLRERVVGVEAAHLRLPVGRDRFNEP